MAKSTPTATRKSSRATNPPAILEKEMKKSTSVAASKASKNPSVSKKQAELDEKTAPATETKEKGKKGVRPAIGKDDKAVKDTKEKEKEAEVAAGTGSASASDSGRGKKRKSADEYFSDEETEAGKSKAASKKKATAAAPDPEHDPKTIENTEKNGKTKIGTKPPKAVLIGSSKPSKRAKTIGNGESVHMASELVTENHTQDEVPLPHVVAEGEKKTRAGAKKDKEEGNVKPSKEKPNEGLKSVLKKPATAAAGKGKKGEKKDVDADGDVEMASTEETPSAKPKSTKKSAPPAAAASTSKTQAQSKSSSKPAPKKAGTIPGYSSSTDEDEGEDSSDEEDESDVDVDMDGGDDKARAGAKGKGTEVIKAKTLPTVAKDDKSVAKKLERARRKQDKEKGVIFLSRIPHGFYEEEMKAYFAQFGDVTRLRLARNKKTGASKHYAYIEMSSKSVAEITAETMHNYLLRGHILQCHVVPAEKVHPDLWIGANRKFRKIPSARLERARFGKERTEEETSKARGKLLKREEERKKKLKDAGIDYEFEGHAKEA